MKHSSAKLPSQAVGQHVANTARQASSSASISSDRHHHHHHRRANTLTLPPISAMGPPARTSTRGGESLTRKRDAGTSDSDDSDATARSTTPKRLKLQDEDAVAEAKSRIVRPAPVRPATSTTAAVVEHKTQLPSAESLIAARQALDAAQERETARRQHLEHIVRSFQDVVASRRDFATFASSLATPIPSAALPGRGHAGYRPLPTYMPHQFTRP